jgi:hypothetical protein
MRLSIVFFITTLVLLFDFFALPDTRRVVQQQTEQTTSTSVGRGALPAHHAVGPIYDKAPALSSEKLAEMNERVEEVDLHVPLPEGKQFTKIPPPTSPATQPVNLQPQSVDLGFRNSPQLFQALSSNDLRYQAVHDLNSLETNFPSEVSEPSLGSMGNTIFWSGNWYASISSDGGQNFRFVDPENTFDSVNGGFCCDQIVNYAPVQDMMLWALQYIKDSKTNTLRIARAVGASQVEQNRWTYWDFTPQDLGYGEGYWFDFPNLTLSANYLYVTSNIFSVSNDSPNGAAVWRVPLSELAAGNTINYEYYAPTHSVADGDSFRCTEGAGFTMYCAHHQNSSQIRILRWPDSGGITTDTVDLEPYTPIRCPDHCAIAMLPNGSNLAGRTDGRILAAWNAKGVLGFMWTARQDETFPYPYVIVAQFDEATRNKISQTPIWSTDTAFLYPTVSVNSARNLAGLISYGGGTANPGSNIWIVDDIQSGFSPLSIYGAAPGSTEGPSEDKWGDYQTVRRHKNSTNTWVAATFRKQNGGVVPRYLWFGRVRDLPAAPSGSANLTPYQPFGWSDRIVVSRTDGTTFDSSSLTTADSLYIDWAVTNNGNTWTETKFFLDLYVDGVQRASWYSAPVLPNDYVFINDYSIGRLSPGSHTIRIVADPTGVISESNESDNQYTKTIIVTGGPPNDNFSNAQTVTTTLGTVLGNNSNATKEIGEPNHVGNSGGASVWYRWTAPATSSVTFATTGSNFDTLLAAYTGSSVGGLTPIASNDDFSGSLQSAITFNASSGVTYYVAVDGYLSAMGSIVLGWSNIPPAPIAGSPTNLTSNSFVAHWNSSAGATGYRLDVSTNNSFSNFVSGYQNLDVGNSLGLSITGLSSVSNYYYRVRAYNPGGTSSHSNVVLASTTGPMIFIEQGTANRAAALDSVTRVQGPFRVANLFNFSADHHTRIILFTSDLGLSQPDSSQLTVRAGGVLLTVENVGRVDGVPGMGASYIILRLPDGLPTGTMPVLITLRGLSSVNSPTLTISP